MKHNALIVTHGQPSDAMQAEMTLAQLGRDVALHLPGWRVGTATLAAAGALADAIDALGPKGVVFPLFMACGWFTGTHLPARLAEAGGAAWHILPPFGCTPAVQDLAVTLVREAMRLPADQTDLILAAHGSGRSAAPSVIAASVAQHIRRSLGLRRVVAAFIDQSPRLADLEAFGPDALCLPYFAANGGHVADDIPAALHEAGFGGRLLPALGADRRVAAVIAKTLQTQ